MRAPYVRREEGIEIAPSAFQFRFALRNLRAVGVRPRRMWEGRGRAAERCRSPDGRTDWVAEVRWEWETWRRRSRVRAQSVADSIRFAPTFGVARTRGRGRWRRERAQSAERGLKTKGSDAHRSSLILSLSLTPLSLSPLFHTTETN